MRISLAVIALMLAEPSLVANSAPHAVPMDRRDMVVGRWNGILGPKPGIQIPLIMVVSRDNDGLKATLSSPTQDPSPHSFSAVEQVDNSVIFKMATPQASYAAVLVAGGASLDGQWTQGGITTHLEMHKVSSS